MWVFERPVRQHHHVVSVIAPRLGFGRVYDHRAVHTALFLKAGVTVVPIRAVLAYAKGSFKGISRSNARERHAWYTVHFKRQ